jgi:hypothetical protein
MTSKNEWKHASLKEKWDFFWKYNKIHVVIWAIGLIVLGIFLYQKITTPVLIFHGMAINTSTKEESATKELTDELLQINNVDPESGQVIFPNSYSYYPDDSEKAEENFDCSEYILIEKEKKSLDFIIGPLSVVQDIAYNGLFQDLENFLTDEEIALCEDHFLYVDTAVITKIANAYEEDKDISSIKIPDASNPEEMKTPVATMIDVSKSEKLSKLYVPEEQDEPIVIAIMTDAPDKILTLKFIQYLMK